MRALHAPAHRALLEDVLSEAYPHATKYWLRLHGIADRGVELASLEPHAACAGTRC